MVKKFQFSEVLGQNVTGNRDLDSWDFFPKIILGLLIKSQEIRSAGIKVLKKKVPSLGKMRSSLRRFHKWTFLQCICISNIARGVLISSPYFHCCKHPLFPSIFRFKKTFFQGLFCIKSYWNQ